MQFKDYFSKQAVDYAKYRPRYPVELFEYLAKVAPMRERAWDCATGNGQAAVSLAQFFKQVIATDASRSQLDSAAKHEHVEYRIAKAEQTDIESRSIDLVTVAQALHWFNLEGFYREAKRVMKDGGVIAVWTYNLLNVSPEIDAAIVVFYEQIVGPYWPPERRLVEDGYHSISFPFEDLRPPAFHMSANWSLPDLLGYLRTWSATQGYIKDKGVDPVTDLTEELLALWGDAEKVLEVRWPLSLRVGTS
ncbi:MAG: class I SAM-dependent methyltransferase [Pyrinomonadaceae bacterium]